MPGVIVDLDGTLLDEPSSEARFVRWLWRQGLLGPGQIRASLAFFLRWVWRYGRHTGRKNKAYLAGLDEARLTAAAGRFAREELVPRLRADMLERLRRHEAAGEVIILLTGAPEFLALPLARHIGARDCCATRCVRRGGRFSSDPPSQHPYGRAKLDLAITRCRAWGMRLAECTAYADASHDIPLLRAAGRPVAVTPDAGLAREARRRGWEVIDRRDVPRLRLMMGTED